MKLIETYKAIILQEYSNKLVNNLLDKFKKEDRSANHDSILRYITRFDQIKQNLPTDKRDITKYTFAKLRDTIIAFNNIDSKLKNTTVEFKDAKPIYNENNLKIYLANTKRACVYYGTGYNFCISSRGDENVYDDYRFKKGRERYTIYFVLDEEWSKEKDTYNLDRFQHPRHLLVILVPHKKIGSVKTISGKVTDKIEIPKNEFIYSVSDADNNGEISMTWEKISKIQPKLTNLQDLFIPVEPDIKEKDIIYIKEKYQNILHELNRHYIRDLKDTQSIGITEFTKEEKEKVLSIVNGTHNLYDYRFIDVDGNEHFDMIKTEMDYYEKEEMIDYVEASMTTKIAKTIKTKFTPDEKQIEYLNKVLLLFKELNKELIFI